MLLSVFLAYSPVDEFFARELRSFIEIGCDDVCFTAESSIRPGHDLISTAEMGLAADVLVLLLSPASNPYRWLRERWEPVLSGGGAETHTRIATVLLDECTFPLLLRRGSNFFDSTQNRLTAMRRLKRWVWGIRLGTSPAMSHSPDLESLYCGLADEPGVLKAPGEMASRFAHQAARDFAVVAWIPAHERTLTQIVGEIGSQLGMTLDGQLEDNCRRVRDFLSCKRCLVVLDAPQVAVDSLLSSGRSSILYTDEPVRIETEERSLAKARRLVSARRFAEAYEMLYPLLRSGVEPEACARELVWICEHWDRIDEADNLRFQFRPSPSEQLRLF